MSEATSNGGTVSLPQRAVNALWPYISGKRGLILVAVAIAGAGVALNWSWLVAAGIAPLLLTALPCVAMCALGLCMNKGGGKSCSSGDQVAGKNPNSRGGTEGDS